MSYQYLGQNSSGNFNYKITLDIFRDCLAGQVGFENEIEIGVYHINAQRSKHKTVKIKLISKKNVLPPGYTNCSFKPDVCIEEGFYEGVIELGASTLGYELLFERCCRNVQNNIESGSSQPNQGQTYYCKIPPTSVVNSSPVFSGIPSPYMCINDTISFLNTAVDIDGDSLVYYFVKPWGGGDINNAGLPPPPNFPAIKQIIYKSGYNQLMPFGTTGYINIDKFNGLTSYLTKQTGNYIVAIEVAEYRNGVLLSTVRLDLQIIFINCPPNRRPTISSDKGLSYTIEAGSKLCFNVIASDADNNNLQLTPKGNIFTGKGGWKGPIATLSAKTGKGLIMSEFCWQTSCEQASKKPYLFAVQVEDDGCPAKYNTVNFKITVNPFVSDAVINGKTPVCQNEIAKYKVSNVKIGSMFEWDIANGIILSGNSTSEITVKWTGNTSGSIKFREISKYNCFGDWKSFAVNITPSPVVPQISGKDTVCLSGGIENYNISNNTTGISYTWWINIGNISANNNNNISIDWNVKGDQKIKVIATNIQGCKSDTALMKINVRKPSPIIIGAKTICPNSKNILYSCIGNNGSVFNWTVNGGNIVLGNNTDKIYINWGDAQLAKITLIETDKFGCKSNPVTFDVNVTYTLDSDIPFGDNSVCEYSKNVPYFLIHSNGVKYNWNINGGTLTGKIDSNFVLANWGAAGNGNLTVLKQAYDSVNKKNCTSLPAIIDVIINKQPIANKIEGYFEMCQNNDSINYTINGFAGSIYFWNINGNSNISGQGTNTVKFLPNTPGMHNINVIELTKDSCLGNIVDSVIIVHPKPTADSIFGKLTVCEPNYSNYTYKLSGINNSQYYWSTNNGSIISGNNTNEIIVNWSNEDPLWIKVVEISEFGCIGDTIFKNIITDKLNLELQVISVGYPDDRMEIKWNNNNSKKYSRDYIIERRNAGEIIWQNAGTIKDFTNYFEQPLNTDNNAFQYRIKAYDLCNVEKTSDQHTNVWLYGSKTEDAYTVKIGFSPYEGWKNGVSKYEIYRKLSDGNFLKYDSISIPSDKIYNNGREDYNQCYRILSYENGGNNETSWSNEICFNFSPTMYIPNAFTPNNDKINDIFEILSAAIKTYNLSIYSRWGEKIWETNNSNEHWDGTYSGNPAQAGVYLYNVIFTDFKNKKYTLSGTVHLIR
ncbi:MAG: gliding motility-associated C-terminal domain-containing protein [Bacteroidia bacterium]|nr:gliding motility-associated C-terminal domain-containing protein [Bacteroidia bacterium]